MTKPAFSIRYRPNAPYSRTEYELDTAHDRITAIDKATQLSRTYYGEVSPIIVREGRKKVFST